MPGFRKSGHICIFHKGCYIYKFSSDINIKLCNSQCTSLCYIFVFYRFGVYQKEPVNMFLMATLLLSDVYPCMEILVIIVIIIIVHMFS